MGEKILIVEDSDDAREVMARLLEMDNYAVITATDGLEGLALTRSERPHLVVTDINMPKLSGIEMIKALRGEPEFSQLPIVVITAFGSNATQQALAAGASGVLLKPVEYDKLKKTIESLLGAPGGASGPARSP